MGVLLRYCNIVLFIIAAVLGKFVFPFDKITQEVLELFPQSEDREIIEVYREFASSRYVLVASKGFGEDSKHNLKAFLERVQALPNVATTFTHTQTPQGLQDFIAKHYVAFAYPHDNKTPQTIAHHTPTQITQDISQGVQALLQARVSTSSQDSQDEDSHSHTNPSKPSFNPHDPLGLFSFPTQDSQELIAKDYGFLGVVELKNIESEALKSTITGFESIAKDFPSIRYFSQNFMDSLNLTLTLEEVGFLLTFSSIVFVVLYFVIIRIPMLTLHTIATLVLANIIAMFVVAGVYPKVTIMALTFGMGISNIAIDYMMHHNFFGLYASKHRSFNRPVFYGYMTTIVGFATCLFIPFPLLAQLSLYAIISLSVSYCFFAFVYPHIGFRAPRFFPIMAKWRTQKVSKWWFFALCVASMGFVVTHLHFDFDLSKLGYYNKEQVAEREFFANAYEYDKSQILLSHKNLQGLITFANTLQHKLDTRDSEHKSFIPLSLLPDTTRLESSKQFLQSPTTQHNIAMLKHTLPQLKNAMLAQINPQDDKAKNSLNELFDTMENAYDSTKLQDLEHLTLKMLEDMGFRVIEHSGVLYYLANIRTEDLPLIRQIAQDTQNNLGDVETRSLQNLLNHITDSLYVPMLVVLGIALCAMLLTLALSARGMFWECAIFVLFPLSSALFIISTHSALDILHLFALLILVVVSVDYGIYAAKEGLNLRTTHAIFFSAITTGVSFGILMLGNTKAIVSFGEVMFVGMVCILVLLFLLHINKR
ncbi:hypothetical protein [uncultured Helicobacter sp.]|uniref:hypothetical protein n=1 Tax=uncultured Helicobacter sp. TaxID=175537 RepID=UPI00374F255A